MWTWSHGKHSLLCNSKRDSNPLKQNWFCLREQVSVLSESCASIQAEYWSFAKQLEQSCCTFLFALRNGDPFISLFLRFKRIDGDVFLWSFTVLHGKTLQKKILSWRWLRNQMNNLKAVISPRYRFWKKSLILRVDYNVSMSLRKGYWWSQTVTDSLVI